MRPLGLLLMLVGFFGASFVSVYQSDAVGKEWQTINWTWYGVTFAVGVAGVVLLRLAAKWRATHSDKLEADISVLSVSLDNLVGKIESLNRHRNDLSVFDVHQRIDDLLVEDLANFVEARESLIHVYDLQRYADLMSEFATSERYINRAWSASADGYVTEVWKSMDVAESRMRNALALLKAYRSG